MIDTKNSTAYVKYPITEYRPTGFCEGLLTHWGQVTHICVNKLTTICSDNSLSPGRHQAIICTNAGILLIRPLGTNFSETLIRAQTFSFRKMELKMSSAKWRPFVSASMSSAWVQCQALSPRSMRNTGLEKAVQRLTIRYLSFSVLIKQRSEAQVI